MLEETLNNVLRIWRRITTPPNECIKWRPVGFAKDSKRLPRRFIRFGLARLQNDGPVRRMERRPTFLQGSRQQLRNGYYLRMRGRLTIQNQKAVRKLEGPRPREDFAARPVSMTCANPTSGR